MMQAEKIAADLRDAHEVVAGTHSPLPMLSAAVRRLERRSAAAPMLIEPAVKAFDAVLERFPENQYSSEAAYMKGAALMAGGHRADAAGEWLRRPQSALPYR